MIRTYSQERRYLRDENLTSIIKVSIEKQTVETLIPRIYQLDTKTQKDVTQKTRSQEETISKNTNNDSKNIPHQKVYEFVDSGITGNDK